MKLKQKVFLRHFLSLSVKTKGLDPDPQKWNKGLIIDAEPSWSRL